MNIMFISMINRIHLCINHFIGVSASTGAIMAGMGQAIGGRPRVKNLAVPHTQAALPEVTPVLPLIIDLENPGQTLGTFDIGISYRSMVCLITKNGNPITKMRIDLAETEVITPELILRHLDETARQLVGIDGQLPRTMESDPAHSVTATVVVATRNRPEQLEQCLASILAGTTVAERIIVVDNAPSDNRTAELMALRTRKDPRLVYIRENCPGLAHAHNAALPQVATDIVAFTDDDVLANRSWLESLVRAFAEDEQAVCVTGMIAPRELDTLPQQWVEGNETYDKGLRRRIFDGAEKYIEHPLIPYASGSCGSGANMAFRTSYLNQAGGFEAALGTGTIAMGGDDLAAFYDVLASGHRLVYEPAAIVLHPHHRDYAALRRQVYGYGAGLGAHLMRCFLRDPRMVLVFSRNAVALRTRATRILQPPVIDGLPPYPKDLLREHRRGLLAGPWRYLRSRRQLKRMSVSEAIS